MDKLRLRDLNRSICCRIVGLERDPDGNKTVKDIREGTFGERVFLRHVKEMLADASLTKAAVYIESLDLEK